jgi:hypothetical protein
MTDKPKKPRTRRKETTVKDMVGLWDTLHQKVGSLREHLAQSEKELRAVETFLEATAPDELLRCQRETNGSTWPERPAQAPPEAANALKQPKRLTIETPGPITDMDNGQ